MEFEKYTVKGGIQQLPDRPKDSAAELKAKFDEAEKNIGEYINEKLIPKLEEMEEYSNIAFRHAGMVGVSNIPSLTVEDKGRVYNIGSSGTLKYTITYDGVVSENSFSNHLYLTGSYDGIEDEYLRSLKKIQIVSEDCSSYAHWGYLYEQETVFHLEAENGHYKEFKAGSEVTVSIEAELPLECGDNIVWDGYYWDKLSCDAVDYVSENASAPVQSGAVYNAIKEHSGNKENPHKVTKEQIGLGNVDNTSDLDKPISTLTQQALDNKENISNKVTEINENSTDEQYPSAKAVWDKFNEKIIDKNVSSSDDFDEFTVDYFNLTSGGSVILKGFITSEYNSYILFVQAGHEDVLSTHQTLLITNSYGRRTALKTRIHASNKWSEWQAYLTTDSVKNDLTSTSTTSPLSANQGRVLNEKIGKIDSALDELHNYAQSLINGGAE